MSTGRFVSFLISMLNGKFGPARNWIPPGLVKAGKTLGPLKAEGLEAALTQQKAQAPKLVNGTLLKPRE